MNKMSDIASDPMTKLKSNNRRAVLMYSIPLLVAAIGLYLLLASGASVSTDNAAVKQDIVSVSAQIN